MLLSTDSAEDLLAYRKADMVFSLFPVSNRSIVCTLFKTLSIVMVCREDHPRVGNSVTLETLAEEKFTLFLSEEPGVKAFQAQTEQIIPERKIGFRSNSFSSLITMISGSNLLGYVPDVIYEEYRGTLKLKKVEIPFSLPSLDIYMLYNRSALNSSVFASFIEQITTEGFHYE